MKLKLFLICVLLFIPSNINAYAEASVVMDADSGRVLYSHNESDRMLIASTTKIMTAIVVLENTKLKDKFTVGEEIKEVYGSMTYIKEGEVLTVEDLLYGLLNRSGNDAAMVLATNIGGYDNFISLMNKKAKDIGMTNTTFENPHGLDDDSKNYSTAYDMALLMKYAMRNKEYKRISNNRKYKVTTEFDTYIWHNKNDLLGIYKYAIAGKIGYTSKSRHVFVSAASKGRENLVISTIKVTDRFNEHKYLYEKYFDEYDRYLVLNKYNFIIKENYYKKYHLYIKNDFYLMLKKSETNKVGVKIVLEKKKKVKSGQKVGYALITVNGNEVGREKIYAIESKSKTNKVKDFLQFWK